MKVILNENIDYEIFVGDIPDDEITLYANIYEEDENKVHVYLINESHPVFNITFKHREAALYFVHNVTPYSKYKIVPSRIFVNSDYDKLVFNFAELLSDAKAIDDGKIISKHDAEVKLGVKIMDDLPLQYIWMKP